MRDYSPSGDAEYRSEAEYLTYMHMLSVSLPETQKDLYQQAEQYSREQGTPHAKLRYALALGLLDAPYGDIAKAQQFYKELLQSGAPPEIQSLLQVRLKEARHRLALKEQLGLLRQDLDKAEAKIKAMTTIEKNLEQPAPETKPKTKAAP